MCISLFPDVKEILPLGCSCRSLPLTFKHWYHKWICIGWYSAKKLSWKRLCDKVDLFFQWKSSPWASDDKMTHSCHPTFQTLARTLFLTLRRQKTYLFLHVRFIYLFPFTSISRSFISPGKEHASLKQTKSLIHGWLQIHFRSLQKPSLWNTLFGCGESWELHGFLLPSIWVTVL